MQQTFVSENCPKNLTIMHHELHILEMEILTTMLVLVGLPSLSTLQPESFFKSSVQAACRRKHPCNFRFTHSFILRSEARAIDTPSLGKKRSLICASASLLTENTLTYEPSKDAVHCYWFYSDICQDGQVFKWLKLHCD